MSRFGFFGLGRRTSPQQRQAQAYAATLRHELTRLKLSARVKQGSSYVLQTVHWEEPLILTPDELWLPIDRQRLPLGIATSDLRREEVVQSLGDRVCAPVRIDTLPGGKLCYVVRIGAASAFPRSSRSTASRCRQTRRRWRFRSALMPRASSRSSIWRRCRIWR